MDAAFRKGGRVRLYLTAHLAEELSRIAEARNTTIDQIVQNALAQRLKKTRRRDRRHRQSVRKAGPR